MCIEGNTFPAALTFSKTEGEGREGKDEQALGHRYCSPATALGGWRAQYSPTVLMAVGKVEEPFQGSLASSIISGCASLGSAPGLILKHWRPRSPTATRGQKPIKSKPTNL